MTTFDPVDVTEYAFGLFLTQGLTYFLSQDRQMEHSSTITYASRLWQTWIEMSSEEKIPYILNARQQLERLRDQRNNLFQAAMQ